MKQSRFMSWLQYKMDGSPCDKCDYFIYECDYWGEYDEYCGVHMCSGTDLHWFCFMPKFIKKIVVKVMEKKITDSYRELAEELLDNEDCTDE